MTEDKRLEIIRKLLAKAEAEGTTPEERDSLGAKASELMIKYGIDEAVARAKQTGEVRQERIITRLFELDVPQSYSYEFAYLGLRIAEAFNAKGFLVKGRRTSAHIVAFESDMALIAELYASLARQCTLNLATWYKRQTMMRWMTGTEKFNAKRGFISGYAHGVRDKLMAARKQAIVEAGNGAELVLVSRQTLVEQHMREAFQLGMSRGRRYDTLSRGAGYSAGQRADIGQTSVKPNTRPALGS